MCQYWVNIKIYMCQCLSIFVLTKKRQYLMIHWMMSFVILYIYRYIYIYILSIDCLWIALDADMFSHNWYGPSCPRTKARPTEPKISRTPLGPWALLPGTNVHRHVIAKHKPLCTQHGNETIYTGRIPHHLLYVIARLSCFHEELFFSEAGYPRKRKGNRYL